jgi:uncharacterized protein (DUF427 family)
MKIPGPDHPITLEAASRRARAAFLGHVIADTDDAIILREASYPPVYYFPKNDVEMSFFAKTEHRTHCPYKGDASYWTAMIDGQVAENVAWSYEDPFPSAMAIRDMIAFYPDRVEVYEVDSSDPKWAEASGGAGPSTP